MVDSINTGDFQVARDAWTELHVKLIKLLESFDVQFDDEQVTDIHPLFRGLFTGSKASSLNSPSIVNENIIEWGYKQTEVLSMLTPLHKALGDLYAAVRHVKREALNSLVCSMNSDKKHTIDKNDIINLTNRGPSCCECSIVDDIKFMEMELAMIESDWHLKERILSAIISSKGSVYITDLINTCRFQPFIDETVMKEMKERRRVHNTVISMK